jgi:hypothetical protein
MRRFFGLLVVAVAVAAAGATGACVIVADDESCTSADNSCRDPWYLSYCAGNQLYGSDCNRACIENPDVYGVTCGGVPAVAGECSAADGLCVCWCEEAFDGCVEGTERVHYVRDGNPYEVDCKEYCDGTCDEAAHACSCP